MSDQLYKGFRPDEMEYQYNPRESVPEFPELAKVRAAQAKRVRESAKSWLNVAYGSSPREMLDIYAADKPGGLVLIYIHGGYWRSGSKEDNCNFVPTFTKRGATVALVEYDLCPQVTVSDIVRQTRAAIAWVGKNITRYRGDSSKIFISGHSAGGHLTAMALAHDWTKEGLPQDCIKGAVATSGVYDLDMVMKISVQEQVRMTPEIAKLNSPLQNPPRVKCPLVVAVGSAEPKGWQQMSENYFNYAKQHGMKADYLVVPGANHYTMSEKLLDETNPLTQAMIRQMGI
jgi:arylformamidase